MPATATGLPITLDNQEVACSLDSLLLWLPEYCFYDYGPLFTLLSSSTWIPPSQQKTMYIHRISWWLCPISPICILGQGFLNKLDTFSKLLLQDFSNSIIVCITAHDYKAVFLLHSHHFALPLKTAIYAQLFTLQFHLYQVLQNGGAFAFQPTKIRKTSNVQIYLCTTFKCRINPYSLAMPPLFCKKPFHQAGHAYAYYAYAGISRQMHRISAQYTQALQSSW